LAAAVLSFRRGLYPQAEAELAWVCEREPDNGRAFYYRGEALNRAGQYEEAIEVMTEAARLLPDDPRPHYTLGHLYDRQGLRAEASEMYRLARDLQAQKETEAS
jgi:Flp pilus assembly protein TadD